MRFLHQRKEILVQKRLPAGDAEHHAADVEVLFHILQHGEVMLRRKALGRIRITAAPAVEAARVALQRQLQEQVPELRLDEFLLPVCRQLVQLRFLQVQQHLPRRLNTAHFRAPVPAVSPGPCAGSSVCGTAVSICRNISGGPYSAIISFLEGS